MRPELYLVALFLFGELILGQADAQSRPTFSPDEQATIERNELLKSVVDGDPWLVRKILDTLPRERPVTEVVQAPNPDLASPRDWQASVEWNELLKRARAEKAARIGMNATTRSAEGAVEMSDWMKRARAKKLQPTQ